MARIASVPAIAPAPAPVKTSSWPEPTVKVDGDRLNTIMIEIMVPDDGRIGPSGKCKVLATINDRVTLGDGRTVRVTGNVLERL